MATYSCGAPKMVTFNLILGCVASRCINCQMFSPRLLQKDGKKCVAAGPRVRLNNLLSHQWFISRFTQFRTTYWSFIDACFGRMSPRKFQGYPFCSY